MKRARSPQSVLFKPWVGEHYQKGGLFLKRVLILGESHYGNESHTYPNFTIDVVQDYINGEFTHAFFSRIVIMFLNKQRPSDEEKKGFWKSVAFYNYIQDIVGERPRIRPTPQMWEASKTPFLQILKNLKPQVIIVLGYTLWDMLPYEGVTGEEGSWGPKIKPKINEPSDTWWYPLGEGKCALAYRILHPSSGRFRGRDWHRNVLRAIELAD